MEQLSYHQSYEEIEKFALDIADTSNIPGDNEELETESYLNDSNIEANKIEELIAKKFADFLTFLLNLNDYGLGIIREIIAPTTGHKLNIAEIARIRNVSRQAMHRKIIDMAKAQPELRELLKCVLMKLRKNKEFFEHSKTKHTIENKHNKSQGELFKFND
jgi:predicted DNA-binding protein YlxM (UPF0122 family)